MKRYAFIINPKSGNEKKDTLLPLIEEIAATLNFECDFLFTTKPGHATDLTKQLDEDFDAVIALGGDGTVNEVAQGLLGSNIPLGIIPSGSGNGIARHLMIPIDTAKALKNVVYGESVRIDAWLVGEMPFFMLCGFGFDAHIAQRVSGQRNRGPQVYFRLVMQEFRKFRAKEILIEWDGGRYSGKPFLVNFANGSQFGNNFKIAPKASISDGYLDLGIIEKIPLRLIPELIVRMRNGTLNNFKYYKTFRAKQFLVQSDYNGINIDGEYRKTDKKVLIGISTKKLNVIVPKGKRKFI